MRGLEARDGAWRDHVAAALCQLLAGELASRLAPSLRSPLQDLMDADIDATPPAMTDVAINALEELAKPVGRAVLASAVTGLGAASYRALGPAGPIPVALAGAVVSARRPGASRVLPAVMPSLAGAVAGGVVDRWLGRRERGGAAPAAASLVALAGLAWTHRRGTPPPVRGSDGGRAGVGTLPVPDGADLGIPGLRPLITPASDVYVTHLAVHPPVVDLDTWRLEVDGLVDRPVSLSYADLLDLPQVEVDATIQCVHNPVGGDHVSTGRWRGVRVGDLLEMVGVQDAADQVLAHAVAEDHFSSGVPLAAASGSLVVLGVSGELLPVGNGAPARMLTPGSYGQWGNLKWLQRLEVTTFADSPDYWRRRGWPAVSWVRANAQVDVPSHRASISSGPTTLAGYAWHPPHGVERVEVSIDDGAWEPATLAAELAPTAWRQWHLVWEATPGSHTVRVRCDDQDGRLRGTFPHGAGGFHTITVHVDGSAPPLSRRWDEVRRRAAYVAAVPRAWREGPHDTSEVAAYVERVRELPVREEPA